MRAQTTSILLASFVCCIYPIIFHFGIGWLMQWIAARDWKHINWSHVNPWKKEDEE